MINASQFSITKSIETIKFMVSVAAGINEKGASRVAVMFVWKEWIEIEVNVMTCLHSIFTIWSQKQIEIVYIQVRKFH